MKRFLLIAGDSYYPSSGTGDWLGTYDSKDDIPTITRLSDEYHRFEIEGFGKFDWYTEVDLHNWSKT